MMLDIRSKAIMLAAGFGISAGTLMGQNTEGRLRTPGSVGVTVSVAALQVPEKAWKHFDKARTAAEQNRLEDFEHETAKALEIAPRFAQAYLLRATVRNQKRNFDAAIADVLSAQKIEPGLMWGGVVLAGAENGLHRYNAALLVLNSLRGPEMESWQVKYELARAEIGIGNREDALHWSKLALDAAPKTCPDIHLLRANALILSHRWEDAIAQMNAYLESKSADVHRAEVMKSLDLAQRALRNAQMTEVASR